jgi:hypothetical protein
VTTSDWLADEFEHHRTRLHAVAYRMLGSVSEADDAVQECWLRLNRSDTSAVDNLAGWLTTVVGRISLEGGLYLNQAPAGVAARHGRAPNAGAGERSGRAGRRPPGRGLTTRSR